MIFGLLIGCVFFILLLLGVSLYFSQKVIGIRLHTPDEIEQMVLEVGSTDWYRLTTKDELMIPSPFGYDLSAEYIEAAVPSKYTIILCHGVKVSKAFSVKYAKLFYELGFNCLIYDHRRHGSSGGRYTTFGYFEKMDLRAVVEWVRTTIGMDHHLGIHGESMGAAILLQYAGMEDGADFYIADCPYADICEQLAYRIGIEYHLPSFPLMPLVRLIIKLRAGFDLKDANAYETIGNIKKPVLFMHGQEDRYIPPSASISLYQAKPEPKAIHLMPGAFHAKSLETDPSAYHAIVKDFLTKIVGLDFF